MQLKEGLHDMRARISAKSKVKGSLLVRKRGNYQYFFHRRDEKDSNGTYISKRNISFARQLAQQDYEHKVLVAAERLESVTAKCIALLEKCRFPDERFMTACRQSERYWFLLWILMMNSLAPGLNCTHTVQDTLMTTCHTMTQTEVIGSGQRLSR